MTILQITFASILLVIVLFRDALLSLASSWVKNIKQEPKESNKEKFQFSHRIKHINRKVVGQEIYSPMRNPHPINPYSGWFFVRSARDAWKDMNMLENHIMNQIINERAIKSGLIGVLSDKP